MNGIIRCLKLVKYGTQAKVSKVSGIIFIVIGIVYFFFTLKFSGWLNGFSGLIISLGGMFLWQPLITCNYLKLTDSAPMRKMMTVKFFPLMTFVTSAAGIVFFAASGGIASAFLPMAGQNAVNAMILIVMSEALMCSSVCMPKLKPVFIFIDWLVCTVALENILADDTYDFAELTGIGYDRIFLWAVIFIAGAGIVCLLCFAVLRLLYKKPYNSFYRKMAENYKGDI